VKVVILSGGMGKRLRPLTDYLPKPLLPICGIPIIEWQIKYFKKFGVDEFIICAGYRGAQIIDFLESKDLGAKISFSLEKSPLGTGGAIKNASRHIGKEDFFVINGDVITNLDLNRLKGNPNSIAVIPLRTNFGVVHIEGNKVRKFEEKPELVNYWMNAGIYYLKNSVLKLLPKTGNIENTAFPKLATAGNLLAVKFERVFWQSVDSHKDIDESTRQMQSIKYEDFLLRW